MRNRFARSVAGLLGPALLALLTACGGGPAPTATPVALPAATAPPLAPAALVTQAIQATSALKRYHFSMTAGASGLPASGSYGDAAGALETPQGSASTASPGPGDPAPPTRILAEGDFVAPDEVHERTTVGGQTVEILRVGGTSYVRGASGAWQTPTPFAWPPAVPTDPPFPPADATLSGSDSGDLVVMGNLGGTGTPLPADVQINPVRLLLLQIPAGATFTDQGSEPVDGVPTRHLVTSAPLAPNPAAANASGGDALESSGTTTVALWIDPTRGIIRKLAVDEALTWRFSPPDPSGPPGTGTPTATPLLVNASHFTWSVVLSRPDDPSITVPAP